MERLVLILQWIVLLPIWRRVIKSPGRQVAAAAGTGLLWIVIIIAISAGSGGGDEDTDSVVSGDATSTPTATVSQTEAPDAAAEPTPESTEDPAPTASTAPPIASRVVSTDDVSFSNVVRIRVRGVVEFPLSKDQAKQAMDAMISDVAESMAVNAVVVFLYDYEELSNGAFTIGKAEFAPDGEWAKAGDVSSGDYSKHETVYEFQPKMEDPESAVSKRPTAEEVSWCAEFNDAQADNIDLSDDGAAAMVAASTGADPDAVLDAAFKCVFWAFQ